MKKHIRRVALLFCATSILIFVQSFSVSAAIQKGDYTMDGGTIVSYSGSDAILTLPDFVTTVGKNAFAGNTSLQKITIPDSVKTIDYAAFEDCPNLRVVKLGEGVKTIGQSAFSGCSSLEMANIPSKCESIGSGAFARCDSLSNLAISNKNENYLCYDGVLYSSDGSTLIQYLAGRNSGSYSMPVNVDTIEEYAFWGADNLNSVTISPSVTRIPDHAFDNCQGLTDAVIPASVTSLMAYSFADCVSLKRLNLPESIGFIDATAFYRSDGVETDFASGRTFGDSNEYGVGLNNTDNTAATQPSVNEASQSESVLPAYDTDNSYFASPSNDNPRLYARVPQSDNSSEYASTYVVGGKAVVPLPHDIPVKGFDIEEAEKEDTESEEDVANGGSTNVSLPSTLEKIKERSFYRNNSIKSVNIPGNVEEIGDFAFARSTLNSVDIPEGVEKIGYAAFYHCANLTDVSIPGSVETIELGAFEGTPWLSSWRSEPDNDNYLIVGDGILLACKNLSGNVAIPEGVKTIAPGCFEGNTSLTGLDLPSSLRVIGEDAFNGCKYLTDVKLNEGLEKIEDRAFKDTGITTALIPTTVREIGLAAFDGTSIGNPLKLAIFLGNELPDVSYKSSASRMSASDLIVPSFNGCDNAFITQKADIDSGSMFDPMNYGFRGTVYSIMSGETETEMGALTLERCLKVPDEDGVVRIDPKVRYSDSEFIMTGVRDKAFDAYKRCYDFSGRKLTDIEIEGNTSSEVEKMIDKIGPDKSRDTGELLSESKAISVNLIMEDLSEDAYDKARAVVSKNIDRYYLDVVEDDSVLIDMYDAIKEYLGAGTVSDDVLPLNISLHDKSGSININRFGKNKLSLRLPIPDKYAAINDMKLLTLDSAGSVEEVNYERSVYGGVNCIEFETSHLSPFVLCHIDMSIQAAYAGDVDATVDILTASDEESDGSEQMDSNESLFGRGVYGVVNTLNKPVVGGLSAMWLIVIILVSLAAIVILLAVRKKMKNNHNQVNKN